MIKRIEPIYPDFSILVSCILMPHVFGKIDARMQSFIGLLTLIDGIRDNSIIAYAAYNEKQELVGAAWGFLENGEFVVHSAFNRHINTEPYINEMMAAVKVETGTETFTAYVPKTYRYVIVGLGMQGWSDTGISETMTFMDSDNQLQPCVKLVKRLQHA